MQAPQAGLDELARAHCPAYVGRFLQGELTEKEMRTIGFPWSEGLVRRSRASAGGTLAATRALFEWNLRITANIAGTSLSDLFTYLHHHCLCSSTCILRPIRQGKKADTGLLHKKRVHTLNENSSASHSETKSHDENDAGGTHHSFRDRGEGFCVFNDIAVSSKAAMDEFGIERILVIDLDVHQASVLFSFVPICIYFKYHSTYLLWEKFLQHEESGLLVLPMESCC